MDLIKAYRLNVDSKCKRTHQNEYLEKKNDGNRLRKY